MDLEQQILHIKTMIITAIINDNDFMGSEEIIEMVNKLERLIIQKQEKVCLDSIDALKITNINPKMLLSKEELNITQTSQLDKTDTNQDE